MASSSSSSVFVSNVDDYLAPSQACVNPLFGGSSSSATKDQDGSAQQQPPNSSVLVPRRRRRRLPIKNDSNNNNVAAVELNDQGGIMLPKPSSNFVIESSLPQQQVTAAEKHTNNTTPVVVKATMADCLACSGCITTAETVLVEQHSLSALRSLCQDNDHVNNNSSQDSVVLVVTVSPAAWADMLRHFMMVTSGDLSSASFLKLQRHLVQWWHEFFHVSIVIDGNIPLQWSLTEAAHEFCHSYQQKEQNQSNNQQLQDPSKNNSKALNGSEDMHPFYSQDLELLPSMALSATQTQYLLPNGSSKTVTYSASDHHHHLQRRPLPLFTSSCPALVCMVEKSTASSSSSSSSSSFASIANLATTQSPMSIAGVLAKQVLFSPTGRRHQPDMNVRRVRHIAVMPCHDKKLEASRKDFLYRNKNDTNASSTSTTTTSTVESTTSSIHHVAQGEQDTLEPSVDLVITTQEWWTLMSETFQQLHPDTDEENGTKEENIQTWIQSLNMAPIMDLDQYCKEEAPPAINTKDGIVFLSNNTPTSSVDSVTDSPDTILSSESDTEPPIFSKGSGGYADFVFCYAAQHLFGHFVSITHLPWTRLSLTSLTSVSQPSQPILRGRRRRLADSKPNDMYQLCLYQHEDGSYSCHVKNPTFDRVVLRFGMAYGLQNVQRMLQQGDSGNRTQTHSSSSPTPAFDYVEAMACPMGCVNGGGQIRVAARETPTETRLRVATTQQIFSQINLPKSSPASVNDGGFDKERCNDDSESTNASSNRNSKSLYREVFPSGPFGPEAQQLLHTRYHVVPPLQYAQGAAAGVAVADLRW